VTPRPTAQADTDTDADLTRRERRERYERVLGAVDGCCSETHAIPGARPWQVVQRLVAHGDYDDPRGVRSALRAARENDDLVAWRDEYGDLRFTPADADRLHQVQRYAGRHLRDPDLVAACHQRIAALEGGDGDE